jgi:protein SCO1/2
MKNTNCYRRRASVILMNCPRGAQLRIISKILAVFAVILIVAPSFPAQEKADKKKTAEAEAKSAKTKNHSSAAKSEAPHHHHDSADNTVTRTDKAKLSIPDISVQTQDGKSLNFYSELVEGKAVIINFIYTSCTAICPMSGDNFSKLQASLGERLNKDVFLISVTTDPEIDTAQKLKTWSERFKPKEGWTLVTGEKTAMIKLLVALTGSGPTKDFHSPTVLLIDDQNKSWITSYGLGSPANLIRTLDNLAHQSKEKRILKN